MSFVADLPTYILQKYIRIGSIWISPDQIEIALHRYVKLLFCQNDSAQFPLTPRGSSTFFRLNNRFFAAFCHHQLKGYSPENVMFYPRGTFGKEAFGGGIFRFVIKRSNNIDEEFIDVGVIEFRPGEYGVKNFSSEFFPVVLQDCWPRGSLGHLIVFGYPLEKQDIKIADIGDETEINAINVKCATASAKHTHRLSARWAHQALLYRKEQFSMNGMSGGAVFHIGEDSDGFFVGLAGLIQRGGDNSDRFSFIDTEFLHRFATT